MSILYEPFVKQYYSFLNEIDKLEKIQICTLGPQGTSSNYAAKYLISNLDKNNNRSEIILKEDFHMIYNELHKKKVNYALIPAAYENITDFFWNKEFENIFNFILETPNYGLVCKKSSNFRKKEKIKVSTVPAVQNLIGFFAEELLSEKKLKQINTNSTTEAVIFLLENKVDIALTNQTSFKLYKDRGLKFISKKHSVKILWSIFKNNNFK